MLRVASPFRGVVFALALLPAAAAAAQGPAGKLTVVSGRVALSRVGAEAPRAAAQGSPIAVGDLLETGADGRAQALLADNTVLNVSTGTSLRILQYSFDPALDRRRAIVKLLGGTARFIVAARPDSRFSVETGQAAISAGAADFVARAAAQQTFVAVLEGSVRVKNVSDLLVEKVDVRANQTSAVGVNAAPSYPAALPAQERKAYRRDARSF